MKQLALHVADQARELGGVGQEPARRVALTALLGKGAPARLAGAGAPVVGGMVLGGLDFDGVGFMSASGNADAFVAKLTP